MSKAEPKSPLTIIAIFAGIIEASALASLPFLGEDSQSTYTWFLVGFPFFLTVLFFLTLNFNYKSLYSPDISEPAPGTITGPAPVVRPMYIPALPETSATEDLRESSASIQAETINATHMLPDISEQSTVIITLRGPAATHLMKYFALQALQPSRLPCNKWILYNLDTGAQTTLQTQSSSETQP